MVGLKKLSYEIYINKTFYNGPISLEPPINEEQQNVGNFLNKAFSAAFKLTDMMND